MMRQPQSSSWVWLLIALLIMAVAASLLSSRPAEAEMRAPTWCPTATWVWDPWPSPEPSETLQLRATITPCPTLEPWFVVVPTRRPTSWPTLAPLPSPEYWP